MKGLNPLVKFSSRPTATQRIRLAQETPRSPNCSLMGPLGFGTTDQVAPSHFSIRLRGGSKFEVPPTATQLVSLVHDTPERFEILVPGLGLGVIDQLVPSHVSTSVWLSGLPNAEKFHATPTATQNVALVHETAFR